MHKRATLLRARTFACLLIKNYLDMKKFFQEFKEFAMRGNVVDMAPAPAPAEPTKEEVLLTEIRDLLRQQADAKK